MNNRIIFLIIFIFISTCKKEKSQSIPDEFVPFVDSFFEEANNRDVNIELTEFDLDIKFADVEEGKAGTCNTKNNEIKIAELVWLNYSYEQKERLIFHELGHCILERSHKNNRHSNGECLSFMNESGSNPDCSTNLCSALWRDYYLDELFNECQKLPDWYTVNQEYVDNDNRIFQVDTTVTASGFGDVIDFDFENNFVIEIEFFDWVEMANFVSLRWDDNYFQYSKSSTFSTLNISQNTKRMYYSDVEDDDVDSKLTIKKIENQYYFFFNEQFVHTFEYTEWENNSFGTIIWAEEIGTEITMGIKVYVLE